MQAMAGTMWALGAANKAPAVFAPSDLANLVRWYKADALALNDNDAIGTWTDSSGNANASQATPTAKPTYKTGVQNGLPVARFDGGDYLDFTELQYTTSGAFTVFAVAKRAGDANILMVLGATTLFSHLSHYSNDVVYVASETGNVGSAAINTATFDIYMWTRNTTNASARRNGAQVIAPGTLTGNINLGRIGGRSELRTTGDIAEIIIYGAALSDENRSKVETYLSNKWAITLA